MIVLLLEDDANVAAGLGRLVKLAGHSVVTATTIAEATAVVESDAGVGVVLADRWLGGSERGTEFLSWLARRRPEVRRVLVSGSARPPDFAHDPPRQWFLLKPAGRRELEQVLGAA